MINVTIEMPQVAECSISECAYNSDNQCHARAITIGDGASPGCDTFFKNSPHTKGTFNAGVGACKVTACTFNSDYECQADEITVGKEGNKVQCLTFTPH